MSLIQLQNVKKSYGHQLVLKDVSMQVEAGEQVVITGPSGSGKSTLLYLLGGLDRPDSGQILVEGKNISKFTPDQLARFRNSSVGFIFQFHFLLPSMDALSNILLPARIAGQDEKIIKKEILKWADELGVIQVLDKRPYQLSGGEQQRIGLLRAISLRPKILLCDEPTGNLDSKNSSKVIHLLKEFSHQLKSALLVVTHDPQVAGQIPRKLFLQDGVLQQ